MPQQSHGPAAKPDYDHWARMARWEWTEFAALSLDIGPGSISAQGVRSDENPLEEKRRYSDRRSLIENHVQAGRVGYYSEPAEFLSWAKSNSIPYPPELGKAVEEIGGKIADWRHENERLRIENDTLKSKFEVFGKTSNNFTADKPLASAERRSLLKMVRAMAAKKYGYDPGARRNTATSNIASDVAKEGFRITDDTVRKWLDEAWRLKPDED